ncbi:MAG: hypothetical protein AB7U75_17360 [Hyphomicrobiaceae bacterium]
MDDKTLQKPVLKDYGESVVSDNSGMSYTIDLTLGNVFAITLTGDCEFTFSNPSASGTACNLTLLLTQDSTGSRTVTWPAAVKWTSGAEPTLFTNPDSVNILAFMTINGGTTWFGAEAGGSEAVPPEVYLAYGYFGGGRSGGTYYSTIDRIDYSNDTATAVAKGPLSLARGYLAATGNSTYGYFGGGYTAPSTIRSTIDRIDYANDTATASAKGPLPVARYNLAATGHSAYGYFGGGIVPPVATATTIDRVDYANDTATASAKGPLSLAQTAPAATGNSTYGYFGGGYAALTTVGRIDYANDTATASAKGPLSVGRNTPTATGHSSYGYFAGGYTGPFPGTIRSTIDRIDYSNDTATAVAKGPLSSERSALAAAGNSTYGYFGGGSNPGAALTNVDRLDYANDTATASAKGPLSLARTVLTGTNHGPV